MEQFKSSSLAALPNCSGCVGMQMLGLAYLMVSKHVAWPPLKMTNLAFFMASCLSSVESHVCSSQLPILVDVFFPGVPKLMMHLVFSFSSTCLLYTSPSPRD